MTIKWFAEVSCDAPGCDYTTDKVPEGTAIEMERVKFMGRKMTIQLDFCHEHRDMAEGMDPLIELLVEKGTVLPEPRSESGWRVSDGMQGS